MRVLIFISYCLGVLSIIGLGFFVVNWARYMKARIVHAFSKDSAQARFPIKSMAGFIGATLLTILVAFNVTSVSRSEMLDFIDNAKTLKAYVNNQPAANSDEIVAALKTVQSVAAHHSHPTKRITIELHSDTGVVTIECGRDSAYPQEYWIFYPKYDLTSSNEIGRITTSALDSY